MDFRYSNTGLETLTELLLLRYEAGCDGSWMLGVYHYAIWPKRHNVWSATKHPSYYICSISDTGADQEPSRTGGISSEVSIQTTKLILNQLG
jgi:hypothetical protein